MKLSLNLIRETAQLGTVEFLIAEATRCGLDQNFRHQFFTETF